MVDGLQYVVTCSPAIFRNKERYVGDTYEPVQPLA